MFTRITGGLYLQSFAINFDHFKIDFDHIVDTDVHQFSPFWADIKIAGDRCSSYSFLAAVHYSLFCLLESAKATCFS